MKKVLFISLAVIFALSVGLIGCEGEGPEPTPLPSDLIGSGQLDGEGIPVDFFTDQDVRIGCCYAFNYDLYLTDAISGEGVQRGAPVTDGLYGYAAGTPMYSYCITKATEHFEDAWDGEVWDKGFKFTLVYNAGNLVRKTACEILAEGLLNVNEAFQVSILPVSWPNMLGRIFGTRDMPLFQIGWGPDYPHADNFINPFMHSQGAWTHYQCYGDSALDALILDAFQETDPGAQITKYAALQQRYHDDAPGICLFQPFARRYFTQHITGYFYNPMENVYWGDPYSMTKSNNGVDIPYKNDGIFIEQTIGDAESLDPAWIYDNASGGQARFVYETLIYYNGNLTDEFVPVLATDTGHFNSMDNTLTFTIADGIPFEATGNNVTAADVEYSIERNMLMDRAGGTSWMYYGSLCDAAAMAYEDTDYATITSSITTSGNNVTFHLTGAHWELPFKQILCGAWSSIVEKDWCITQGAWDGTESGVAAVLHPEDPDDTALYDIMNGTGGWKLNSWTHGTQLRYDANPSYHGGSVPFDTIYYKIVQEWTSRKLALLAGDADLVYVPATNYADVDTEAGLNIFKDLPSLNIDAFFFNFCIGGPSE